MVNRVLVVGLPRSGTTWVGQVLGATEGAAYVDEPDNHLTSPFALRTKRQLGMRDFPALGAGSVAPEYASLWDNAFATASSNADQRARGWLREIRRRAANRLLCRVPRTALLAAVRGNMGGDLRIVAAQRLAVPERPPEGAITLVVKSVYTPLAVEWIAHRITARVVVVLRGPLNVLSSWAKLEWLGQRGDDMLDLIAPEIRDELTVRWRVAAPPAGAAVVSRAAWMIGALTCALSDAAARHHNWVVVTHEELCANSHERFGALAAELGLTWTDGDARRLDAMNREGGDFEPHRIADELIDVWRLRLDPEQVAEAKDVLDRFPLHEQLARVGVSH
jgi:hypothetical protein